MNYYIRRLGKIQGPISNDQIKKLFHVGRILSTDQIAISLNGPWKLISQVRGLVKKSDAVQISNKNTSEIATEIDQKPEVIRARIAVDIFLGNPTPKNQAIAFAALHALSITPLPRNTTENNSFREEEQTNETETETNDEEAEPNDLRHISSEIKPSRSVLSIVGGVFWKLIKRIWRAYKASVRDRIRSQGGVGKHFFYPDDE